MFDIIGLPVGGVLVSGKTNKFINFIIINWSDADAHSIDYDDDEQ